MRAKYPERRRVAAVLAVVLFFSPVLASRGEQETGKDSNSYTLNGAYFGKLWRDAADTRNDPLHWGAADILKFSLCAAGTALLFFNDQKIADDIRKVKTPATADKIVSYLGNGVFLLGYNALLYAAGAVFDSRNIRKAALIGFEAFVVSGSLVLVLKSMIGRARPTAHEGAKRFHPFAFADKYAAFPSGDAASAYAVATVLAEQFGSILAGITGYGLATLVSLNRVHDGKHWPSDMFAGAVIGYFIGKKISDLNSDDNPASVRLSVEPSTLGPGLSVVLRF